MELFRDAEPIEVLSLAHHLNPSRIVYYPGDPEYKTQPAATFEKDGYALNYICVGEHTGTHWGAPSHFNAEEASADELDPEDFFLPAVLIDIRHHAEQDEDYAVSVRDLQIWESTYGNLPKECAVILNTGWHKRWPTVSFANLDEDGVPRHPGFSLESVRYLLDKGVIGHRGALGTDAFSPDIGVDQSFDVSHALYREHRISIEVLANLDRLPPRGFWITVGGFITARGTGSPAAVQAILPRL